jgi:hypothetical protein
MTAVSQPSSEDSASTSSDQYVSMSDEDEWARQKNLGREDLSQDLEELAMDTGYGIGFGGMP